MELTDIILLSAGVGLNVFTTTQKVGASQADLGKKKICGYGLLVGLMEAVMLLAGIGLSILIPTSEVLVRILVLALVLIGCNMVRVSIREKNPEEHREEAVNVWKMIRLALWTEIKTVMIGFCFAWEKGNPWGYGALIWIVAAMLAAMGFAQGYWMGFQYYRLINAMGGVMIVLAVLRLYFRLT